MEESEKANVRENKRMLQQCINMFEFRFGLKLTMVNKLCLVTLHRLSEV